MNKSANNVFRRLKKDRTMLLIGMIAIALIMTVSLCISFAIVSNRERRIVESQVATSSVSTAERFEELIHGGMSQIRIACDNLALEDPESVLTSLADTDIFSGAALLDKHGKVISQSGSMDNASDDVKYVKYDYDDGSAYVCIGRDGAISIRTKSGGLVDIRAWIRPERVRAIFSDGAGNEYNYCLYNSATGAYYVNKTHFTENSYFDSLLARNGSGKAEPVLKTWNASSAQTMIDDDAAYSDGPYYIAQARTDIGNICLSIVASQNYLERLLSLNSNITLHISLIFGAAFLLIFCMTFFFRHRVTKVSEMARCAFDMEDMMLHRAANGTQMTLMAYNAASDSFEAFCESDNEAANNGVPPRTLRAFAERYGIIESEVERMYAACRGLKPGERASLDLNALRGSDERCLHIHLHAAPDNRGYIICSLHDCTKDALSGEKARQDTAFRANILPKCISAWDVNASGDRWRAGYCAKNVDSNISDMAEKHDLWRDYTADLDGGVRAVIHPEDYDAYVGAASSNAIIGMYQSGRTENVLEYRARTANTQDYEWHRQILRAWKNQENGDILASLYVINIDAERKAEIERRERNRVLQQSLTALGGLYFALFYADLDNDICNIVKAPGGEIVARNRGSYQKISDAYIERTVHPDDRSAVRDMLSAYFLRRTMTETDHLKCCEYRRMVDDRYERAMVLVQAARFENGTVRDVVIALRYLEKTEKQA